MRTRGGGLMNGSLTDTVMESAADLAAAGRDFLASERGKNIRRSVAAAVLIVATQYTSLQFCRARVMNARDAGKTASRTGFPRGGMWGPTTNSPENPRTPLCRGEPGTRVFRSGRGAPRLHRREDQLPVVE